MVASGKVGILTGGGDVPGLNSVIKAVVYRSDEAGKSVVGLRKGWKGLTDMTGPEDANYVMPLDRLNTRSIDRTGGTMLHTSRTNPVRVAAAKVPAHISKERLAKLKFDGKNYDFTPIVLENLEALGVGCLVAIGGDDTLSFASVLSKTGFPVIGIPKTMDNDVQGTEYCIGFSTAITRAADAINRQRTTIGSHERIGIFRIFGRDAGFTALYTAYVTGARCLIPEHPFNLDRAIELLIHDKSKNPGGYSLIIMSEGAIWEAGTIAETGEADAFGHKKKVDVGRQFSEEITRRTGEETINSDLTYDLRSGAPDAIDQIVATTFGNIAMDLIISGISGRMVGVQKGCYAHTSLPDTKLGARHVDIKSLYNTERYRPHYSGKLGIPLLFNEI
ncbi:MAG TPA: 6-phosphofructokinase [Candidatus Acidoferrum sp.]|nr:6-phosphofructokinase [Candidatus Acidoferrum sp.]